MRLTGGNSPEAWTRAVTRMIMRLALYAFLIWGTLHVLGRLRTIILYLLIAIILAYVMRPMASFLIMPNPRRRNNRFGRGVERIRAVLTRTVPQRMFGRRVSHHGRRAWATIYVLIFLFVGGYFSVRFMLNPFVEQVTNVVKNWDDVYKPQFDKYFADAKTWYEAHVKPEWREQIEKSLNQGNGEGFSKQISAFAGEAAKHLGDIAHNIVEIVLLPVLAFYFALDSKKLKHELLGAVPADRRRHVARVIHDFNLIMYSFVVGQVILCTLAGVFIFFLLLAMGVPYALTLGLLAGVTRAIPIIGPILGGIPIILLTLLTAGMAKALIVLAVFTFLHFAESKFIMPMIIGERMNLHPVTIIIVLLIGQEFGGLLGMFFAAPIAALLRVIVRRYWIDRNVRQQSLAFASVEMNE